MKIKKWFKQHKFKIKLLEFFKWKIIDLYRFKKFGKPLHLFGIRCITGMYGQGKTMAMSYIAKTYRDKYGDDIYICTNYGLSFQDFAFDDIFLVSKQYDKPIIFFWDEVQNDFPSQEKNFPKALRQALTLNRKGNGKMFYWASQDHELVHKTIRRLTIEYGLVKTLFGRFTRVRWYLADDYQRLFEEKDFNKKRKIHPVRVLKFIQDDYIRECYNSYAWDNGEQLENVVQINEVSDIKDISKNINKNEEKENIINLM